MGFKKNLINKSLILLALAASLGSVGQGRVEAAEEYATVTYWDTELESLDTAGTLDTRQSVYVQKNVVDCKVGQTLLDGVWDIIPTVECYYKKGRILEGWYLDKECTQRWDYHNNVVTGDMNLYPKYNEFLTVTVDNNTALDFRYNMNEIEKYYEQGINYEGINVKEGYETQESWAIYNYFNDVWTTNLQLNSMMYVSPYGNKNSDGYLNENAYLFGQLDDFYARLYGEQLASGEVLVPYSKINTHMEFNQISLDQKVEDEVLAFVEENAIIGGLVGEKVYEFIEAFETKASVTEYGWDGEIADYYDIDYVTVDNGYVLFYSVKGINPYDQSSGDIYYLVDLTDEKAMKIDNEWGNQGFKYKIGKFAVVRVGVKQENYVLSMYDGDNLIDEVTVSSKVDLKSVIAEPVKKGYKFVGWYAESGLDIEYDFDKEIAGNRSLFAKFVPVEDTTGIVDSQGLFIDKLKELVLGFSITLGFVVAGAGAWLAMILNRRKIQLFNDHETDEYALDNKYVLVHKDLIKSEDNGIFKSLWNEILNRNEYNTWYIKVPESVVNDQVTNQYKLEVRKGFAKKHNGETLFIKMGTGEDIPVTLFEEDTVYKFDNK